MADVFISYASEDRDRVRRLAGALAKRGLDIWWDRVLVAGDDYANVIERELSAAKAVLVVWSKASVLSPFVRDEAGRARNDGRLVPILIERGVTLPLGFGAFQTEDFTSWNEDDGAAQIDILEAALRARIEGRAPDSELLQAKRTSLARRVRLMSILGVVATLLGIAASVYTLTRPRTVDTPVVSQQDQLSQLLQLVSEGKITGEQALELSKLIETRAFAGPAATEKAAEEQPAQAQTEPPQSLTVESDEVAFVTAAQMEEEARASFTDATRELLQSPDARVRQAVVDVADPTTRGQGLNSLWDIAKEGGAGANAIWRACGSLMLATGDPRAMPALQRAAAINPQDKRIWRMLSYGYAKAGSPKEAASATLVGEGLEAAGRTEWAASAKKLELALPLTQDPKARRFILGQLGDAAAQDERFAAAARRYRAAIDLHVKEKDVTALGVDAQKLARVQTQQGATQDACQTLRRAKDAGASIEPGEITKSCGAQPAIVSAPE